MKRKDVTPELAKRVTRDEAKEMILPLMTNFASPNNENPEQFWKLLLDRIIANGAQKFSLPETVNWLLDNKTGDKLFIADIIQKMLSIQHFEDEDVY